MCFSLLRCGVVLHLLTQSLDPWRDMVIHVLGHILICSLPPIPSAWLPPAILEGLSGASWEGVPGGAGCTTVEALLWVGEVEYICGPGPHQAAHQGEAPVGRAQESGNDNVSEKENVHVDLYICGPVPHQAAH